MDSRNPTFPILRALAYTTGLGYRPTCDLLVHFIAVLVCGLSGFQIGRDLYIVRNGAVIPYLRDDGLHRNAAQLPVLPPEITRIEVTWVADDDVVYYMQCLFSVISLYLVGKQE